MIKRGLFIIILALFTACGGGGSSDKNETTMEDLENGIDRVSDMNRSGEISDINLSDKIPTNSNDLNSTMDNNMSDLNLSIPNLNLKRGYYVDSPVEGVEYDCDIKKGTTDTNGTFYFEEGKTCVFTLAGVVLREFNTTGLEDNVVILENNVENARLLQVLDVDGNSDNGIQLTKDVLNELVNSGIDELPASNEDINKLFGNLEEIEGYDGALVSLDEARTHLEETITSLGLDEYLDQIPTDDEIEEVTDELDSILEGL